MKPPAPLPCLRDTNHLEHVLVGAQTTLGRALENDIVIASQRVSREHARIVKEGRRWLMEDLGSTNGTFINSERVQPAAPQYLRDGDQISLGGIELTFHDPDVTTRETPFPELEINLEAGVVRVDRVALALSPKELALLAYLYQQSGKVCSKEEIGRAVWVEYQQGQGVYDYQIENLVRRLRTKIEKDPNNPDLLITVRGLGYKLVTPKN